MIKRPVRPSAEEVFSFINERNFGSGVTAMAKDLSDRALKSLTANLPTTRRETPDAHVRGLYLVQQPSGSASWALRFRFYARHENSLSDRFRALI